MRKVIMSLLVVLVVGLMVVGTCFAVELDTINAAFANGKTSGTIGTYFEYKDMDVVNSDTSWATAYLLLNYETAAWKNVKAGASFMAHGEYYNEADVDGVDPYSTDIETPYTLPQVYLNVAFMDNSNLLIGRFDHKEISHIDDAQSEGFYLAINEIENLELVGGLMTRFAEIDYDDSEDFGRTNKAQDLSSDTFGANSDDYLLFLEGKTKVGEMIDLNPYVMYQGDYATVAGIDTKLTIDFNETKIGVKVNYYNVSNDVAGMEDSNDYAIYPFIKDDAWKLVLGYIKFDDGAALNRPLWLTENHMDITDQTIAYGMPGSEVYIVKLKYKVEKLWASILYSVNEYDRTATMGDKVTDYEFQVGYDICETLDANLRLFDVSFDNVNGNDYQKLELCVRKKF